FDQRAVELTRWNAQAHIWPHSGPEQGAVLGRDEGEILGSSAIAVAAIQDRTRRCTTALHVEAEAVASAKRLELAGGRNRGPGRARYGRPDNDGSKNRHRDRRCSY